MPAERVAMRQAHEIIRLKFSAGLPTREIARRLGVAASTVRGTLRRFEGAGLSWPLPVGMSDGDLEAALYANHGTKRGHRRHAEPDWPTVHRELKRKHVTLVIVWDEYIAANPGGYSYSRFCELYRGFELKLSPTMRQTHAAGERLFVDYAGDGVPVVIDRLTGEIRKAQIFVAVLGASSFTFAHASWTQALPDWIDAHVRALEVIGGVPHLLVPDNTKTAVIKACLYDPQVNRTYAEMAAHYDTAIFPARPRRPRDKASPVVFSVAPNCRLYSSTYSSNTEPARPRAIQDVREPAAMRCSRTGESAPVGRTGEIFSRSTVAQWSKSLAQGNKTGRAGATTTPCLRDGKHVPSLADWQWATPSSKA